MLQCKKQSGNAMAAEVAEDNNDKRESDVATVTAANNNSNSNSGS